MAVAAAPRPRWWPRESAQHMALAAVQAKSPTNTPAAAPSSCGGRGASVCGRGGAQRTSAQISGAKSAGAAPATTRPASAAVEAAPAAAAPAAVSARAPPPPAAGHPSVATAAVAMVAHRYGRCGGGGCGAWSGADSTASPPASRPQRGNLEAWPGIPGGATPAWRWPRWSRWRLAAR